MSAYYNENDPKAAAWLRELIKEKLIAGGEVDERSIKEVSANDLLGFTQCHFFAGIGGWSYALKLAGWPDERPVWTGSCPCQPFSSAGKRKGASDERHLWPVWFELIRQGKPEHVFGEQVASKDGIAWLDTVQSDLESEGYTAGAVVLPACGVGAPFVRSRIWLVAMSKSKSAGLERLECNQASRQALSSDAGALGTHHWKLSELPPARLAHELPRPMAIVRGIGNAIVPQAAAEVIKAYMEVCA